MTKKSDVNRKQLLMNRKLKKQLEQEKKNKRSNET